MARSVLLAFLFVSLVSASAFAQTISGRVTDPQSHPVAGARVLVTRGTSTVATVMTNADGRYGPIPVPAGEYEISVAASGLRAAPKRVTVTSTAPSTVDIPLAVAAVSESIVVSASQVDRPLSRITDSVTVIEGAKIQTAQFETATDALRLVPGFSVVSSGGRGAITSIFPRGGESDYTLVLVDGIALNSFGGGFDGAHLPTAGIDRIEVVRGPQSAVFGSGAIGGVVNIITRKGGPTRANGLMEFGGQGTSKFLADAGGAAGAWSWGGSIERLASDGDTSFRSSIGRNVTNDDYERVFGSAGLAWSGGPDRRLRFDARFGRTERGFPGAYGSDPAHTFYGLDTISRGINKPRGISAAAVFGDASRLRQSGQFSWSDAKSLFISPFGESDDRTRRVTGRYQADLERGRSGWSAGIEAIKERADNAFVTGTVFQPVPVSRNITGLFIESRWDLTAKASLTAGIRAERIERASLQGDGFGSRPAFDSDVVWSANPKISAAWFIRGDRSSDAASGWTKLRGGAGTGIKPPTVFEIAFTNNPSLKPERNRSADFGVEHAFPGGLAAIDATVFANRYDDLIVTVKPAWAGASQYLTDNIANASAKGLEVGVRIVSRHGITARGAYALLSTKILSVDNLSPDVPAPYTPGNSLIRRPRHQGSLELQYSRDRTQLFLMMNGRGRMADLEPNVALTVLSNPGFAVFALGGSYRLVDRLEFYARVTNLLDRAYEDVLGFPAQARSASAGLRVAVGR